jgi:hypothetical protein
VPRAKPFTRADVKSREALYEAISLDPAVIEKIKAILKFEGVAAANGERLVSEIEQAIRTYKLTARADYQESPAHIVAALKPGLPLAKRLREWLNTLPQWLRFDLKFPELEELLVRIKAQSDYWQAKVRAGPIGHGPAALSLRQSLCIILAKDIKNERKMRRAMADILKAAGIKFPDEKKNPRRFTGTARPK